MNITTSELRGLQLDYAVALIEGHDYWRVTEKGRVWTDDAFTPSTDWAQGGPIIERECIEVGRQGGEWIACIDVPENGDWEAAGQYGPTLLIAAMRCFVQSKLGDEVEIPEVLL